jgi:rhodanese-related sulfurtransferase
LAGWGPYTLASVAELLWVGNQTYFKEGLRKARVPPDADWTKLVKKISTGDAVSQYRIEGAETINLDQAKMLHGQNIPFVDVSKFWERERIPGTHFLMIWFLGDSDFNQVRLERVAKRDQPVVIYSSGLERRAVNAVAKAVSWGFKNLYYFPDGLKKWKSEGYSVER